MVKDYEIGGVLNFIKKKSSKEKDDEVKKTKRILKDLFSNEFAVLESNNNHDDQQPIEHNEQESLSDENKIKDDKTDETKKIRKKKKKSVEDIERLSRTLFVGNVATSVSRKNLKKLFAKYGSIETVRIRSVPVADPKTPKKIALIKKNFHAERETMNAYVVFKDKISAEKSLAQNGYVLEGHRLRLDSCNAKQKHDHQKCLFVGNLPFNIKEDDLFEHFSTCGDIDDVRIIRDKESGIGKGFAYVKFLSKDSVVFGLKLDGSQLNGRKLRITRSKQQPNKKNAEMRISRSNKKDKHIAYQGNNPNNSKGNAISGLKSTRKKDREIGRKLFSHTNKQNSKGHSKNKHSNNGRKSNHGNAKKRKT